MFFAFSAFAISVAQITQTFFKFSERKRAFNEDMAAVRMHLRDIKVPELMQNKMKSYLRHIFEKRRIIAKEQGMISHLPEPLKKKLKHHHLVGHFNKLEILNGMPGWALYMVSELAEIRDMAPGDLLSYRGQATKAAWALISGRLKRIDEQRTSADSLRDGIVDGNGEMCPQDSVELVDVDCLENNDAVSTDTVIVVVCSEMLRIDKDKFIQMARSTPGFNNMMRHSRGSCDCYGSSPAGGDAKGPRSHNAHSSISVDKEKHNDNHTAQLAAIIAA